MDKTTTINGLKKDDFKKQIQLFILTNKSGLEVSITNFGGRIVSLIVPDKDKKPTNVVLGYSNIDDYLNIKGYLGATVGRVANRVAEGKFSLGGKQYQLDINNAPNIVHGGSKGFSYVIWDAVQPSDNKLQITYLSPDGDQGFPGNLKAVVTFELPDDGSNKLRISYEATTDKETIVNLTNHSFFNLSGAGNGNIEKHILTFNADKYTPTSESKIPIGEIAPVAGTPFDFTTPHAIGDHFASDHIQIKRSNGYDHNFVITRPTPDDKSFILAAKATSPDTGITLEMYTTEPGIQFFTRNGNGHDAFCLQAQHFPDSINQPTFPSVVLKPGEVFQSTTTYTFTA